MTTGETTAGEMVLGQERAARERTLHLGLGGYRSVLAVILAIAAFLNCYQLDRIGYGNSYYAAAVKSMLRNWHNFFFNSFDPGGFVTIDKPPLGFWFQVASAKLFGYNGVSLLLPEALAGVLSVLVLYHLVRRSFGKPAGLLAAAILAVTPVAVVDSRSNIIDSILTLFLLLGAWAAILAVETGRLRWLMLCAVLIGLGFNVKMLEAYLVVPALGLLYLVGSHTAWRARLVHLLLATIVLLAVSLSWATAVDLTPASQRPWVDSTTSNSELDLAIGYNGLDRLLGRQGGPGGGRNGGHAPSFSADHVIGSAGSEQTNLRIPAGQNAANFFNNGQAGPLRLLDSDLGGQDGWLLPLALITLLVAGSRKVRFPLSQEHRGLLLWGTWLLTTAIFFSVANFFHSYYLVTMAPAVAALAGIGLVALWREYIRHPAKSEWRPWVLPATLLITATGQAYILRSYSDWNYWMTPLIVGLAVIAAVVLGAARLLRRLNLRLWTPIAAATGAVALLIAPVIWTAETVGSASTGLTPSAGPAATQRGGFGRFGGDGFGGRSAGPRAGDNGAGANDQLLHYLEQHQGSTRYLVATTNSNSAAPYIIQTGKPVMSLGGFSGSDPILTTSRLAALVKNNTIRYFLLNGGGGRRNFNLADVPQQFRGFLRQQGGSSGRFGGFGGFGGLGQSNQLTSWIQQKCTLVPASAWGGTTTSQNPNPGFGAGGTQGGSSGFGSMQGSSGGAPGFGNPQGGNGGGAQSGQPGGAGVPGFGGGRGFGGGGFGGGSQLYYCGARAGS